MHPLVMAAFDLVVSHARRYHLRCVDCDALIYGGPQLKRCAKCKRARVRAAQIDKEPSRLRLRDAIRRGLIVRPTYCQLCAKDCRPDGHHFAGYSAPNALKVIWLCRLCHAFAHRVEEQRRWRGIFIDFTRTGARRVQR